MKKNLLFLVFILSAFSILDAQTNNLKLRIYHALGTDGFALNQTTQGNMEEDFQFTRVQYYLSDFQIIEDDVIHIVEDVYALVDASSGTYTDINLGDIPAFNIDGIIFSVGVNAAANHADPSLYDANHPLAPQNPTMHWGWTSGYRFAAIEGVAGANMGNVFQIHALEDENYFFQVLEDVDVIDNEDERIIPITGDYNRIFENVSIANGLVVHGGFAEAVTVLENFRDFVFSPAYVLDINDYSAVETFKVYPNPTVDRNISVELELVNQEGVQVQLINVLGQIISTKTIDANTTVFSVDLPSNGLYFLNINQNGKTVASQRVISE